MQRGVTVRAKDVGIGTRSDGEARARRHTFAHCGDPDRRHRHHRSAAGADLRAENEAGNRPVDLAWDIRGNEAYWHLVVSEGLLVSGRTFSGGLSLSDAVWDNGSHYDVWSLTARAAGQRVAIDMESDDVDAYLRVLRHDGTVIATDDDGGSGSNARLEFQAPYAGDNLVVVTSYEAGETGSYRVRVR